MLVLGNADFEFGELFGWNAFVGQVCMRLGGFSGILGFYVD